MYPLTLAVIVCVCQQQGESLPLQMVMGIHIVPSALTGSITAGKPLAQERKAIPPSREIASSKSPHATLVDHHHPISPYDHLLRGVSSVDLYRGHIPLAFDHAAIPRGIPLEAGILTYWIQKYFQ